MPHGALHPAEHHHAGQAANPEQSLRDRHPVSGTCHGWGHSSVGETWVTLEVASASFEIGDIRNQDGEGIWSCPIVDKETQSPTFRLPHSLATCWLLSDRVSSQGPWSQDLSVLRRGHRSIAQHTSQFPPGPSHGDRWPLTLPALQHLRKPTELCCLWEKGRAISPLPIGIEPGMVAHAFVPSTREEKKGGSL